MRSQFAAGVWVLILMGLAMSSLLGCGQGDGSLPAASIPASAGGKEPGSRHGNVDPVTLVANNGEYQSPAQSDQELHPEVAIHTNLGTIRVRLNWEKSPRTVANFLYNYVETGFYDQTIIHYVDVGYMVAGGGYTPTYQEKPTQPPIPCEATNQLSNRRGTIAMARHPDFVNSATSQFFINLVDNPGLDYRLGDEPSVNGYCVFGEVIDGMDVVDRIARVPVQNQGDFLKTPVTPVVVESVIRTK